MQKKFVGSLLLLLFLNILIKPIWIFGIDLTVQNRVGAEEYGLYSAIFSFTMILNILLDVGLTHYNNQAIAKNFSEIAKNFSKLTSLKIFLAAVYAVVTLLVGLLLGYTHAAFYLLLVLALNQVLASFLLFLRSHLSGLHLFKTDSVMSVADKLLMVLVCGVLLFTPVLGESFNVMHFALAQLLSYLLVTVVAFAIVLKKARVFAWRFSFLEFSQNLKKSFPYALLILLMAMYTKVDSIMLERIKGAFENGVYAQAFRLLDAVNQVGYLFSVLLLPMFSGMLSRKEDVNQLSRLSFGLVYVAMLSVSLAGFFSAYPIMNELYVDHSELSAPVFRLLILSSIAFGTTFVFGTLLTARGNLFTLNGIALSGFVLNVILNLLLIPGKGAEGAAVATLITQFLTAIVQLVYSLRVARLDFGLSYWVRMFFYTLTAVGGAYFLQYMEASWVVIFTFSLVAVALLSLAFRLFDLKAAVEMLRQRFR